MNFTHAIYQPGATSCQTVVYKDPQGLLRAAYTSEKPFGEDPAKYPDKRADEYLEELNRNLAKDEPDFQLLSWDEASPQITEAEDKEFPTPWVEISHEKWDTMLNILPPCRWRTVRGVEMFFVSEAYVSNFHEHYARLGDRYFNRRCRTSVPYEDLADEVAEFAGKTGRRFLKFSCEEIIL
jgi:hypothetical protein